MTKRNQVRPIPSQARSSKHPPKKPIAPPPGTVASRFKRLRLQLQPGIIWLLAKYRIAWNFIVRRKKSTLLACLSLVVGWYAYFVTALSITPGEPPTSNPLSAPFFITNQRSLLPLMDVEPDCEVHHIEMKNHPSLHLDNNDFGGYRKPIPVLAPEEQTTVYCRGMDMGPLSFADVTVSVLYRPPLHLPCYGRKWQRFVTYAAGDGKLKWKPYASSDAPVPKSMIYRRRFYCW